MFELFIASILPFAKDVLPWIIIAGSMVKWWFTKKKDDETTSISRIETLSKVEERLRLSLEKQLAVTDAKLELANKEVERLRLLIASYEIELKKLKAELEVAIQKSKRGSNAVQPGRNS
jgi:hypothetical protein